MLSLIAVLFFFNVIRSSECTLGSQECSGEVLRICTEDGYWSEMPCPQTSKCTVDAGIAMCKSIKINNTQAKDGKEIVVPKKIKVVTVTKKAPRKLESNSTDENETKKQVSTSRHQLPTKIQLEITKIDSKTGKNVPISAVFSTDSTAEKKPNEISASINEIKTNPDIKNGEDYSLTAKLSTKNPSSNEISSKTVSYKSDSIYGLTDTSRKPLTSQDSLESVENSKPKNIVSSIQNSESSDKGNKNTFDTTESSQTSSSSPRKDENSKGLYSYSKNTSTADPTQSQKYDNDSSTTSIISHDQLSKALNELGYTPNPDYLNAVIKGVNSNFKDKELAAMFLAQISHETGGIVHIEEVECKNNKCTGRYDTGGLPGKSYHGRGFIQLTWPENYKKASSALGMGEKLYQDPDIVVKDLDIAFRVSFWYWDNVVMKAPGVSDKKQFGLTTKAINGQLECNGGNRAQVEKRYKFYQVIAKSMGITNLAQNTGC